MEAHNFPEGEKVRHFSVTLIGEARLWFESLALLDNDWPALQNKFRWQYSKIGNTPKELLPEGEKVRHFSVTLIGEARLWYKSLALLDNDWPALQNKFRWQYSKIGNTPKELFHAWRTFKFDENTDSIDSYVLRMS